MAAATAALIDTPNFARKSNLFVVLCNLERSARVLNILASSLQAPLLGNSDRDRALVGSWQITNHGQRSSTWHLKQCIPTDAPLISATKRIDAEVWSVKTLLQACLGLLTFYAGEGQWPLQSLRV